MASHPLRPHGERRWFLQRGMGAGLVALGMVTGCGLNDPRVDDSDRTPPVFPTPTPTPPLPGSEDAVATEAELAALAATVLDEPDGVNQRIRVVLAQLRTGHDDHARALLSPDPTTRPQPSASPSPSPSPSPTSAGDRSPSQIVKAMTASESATSATYRELALATNGYLSLFWASMAAASAAYALALEGKVTPGDPGEPAERRPPSPVSDLEAMQALLRQEHAILYGYQLAAGSLSGSPRDRAIGRLRQHRRLRDELTDLLLDRSVDPPVAEPAYEPPVQVTDSRSAIALLQTMESALLPFAGQWVSGTADDDGRTVAVAALVDTSVASQGWGSTLPSWPGWPN